MLIFSKENAQQLEATIVDLGKTIESQLIEADDTISQWETRCSTFSSQLEETEQGLNDKLQKIEQLEQQLTEKDEQEHLNTTQINEIQGILYSREQQVSLLNNELIESSEQSEKVVLQWQGKQLSSCFDNYNRSFFFKSLIDT